VSYHILFKRLFKLCRRAASRSITMNDKLIWTVVLVLLGCLSVPQAGLSAERSVIIGFHKKPGFGEHALLLHAGGVVKRSYHLIPAIVAKIPEHELENLRRNPHIAYIEEDATMEAIEQLPGTEYENSWGVRHIGCEPVHDGGFNGAGIKVAILDTGVDYNHEELSGNYRGGRNFVEYVSYPADPDDPFDDSWNSHGTHVAGIIAAARNGAWVVGAAPKVELYAVKVLDGSGHGATSWIISGIQWAVENQMDIVNISIEGTDSTSLQEACDAAYEAGVLLVAAAGNTYGGAVTFPAAYDSVIAVSGTNQLDERAYFSPIGPEVELTAPGLSIFSTVSIDLDKDGYHDDHDYLSGTSQAAPHVAGVAALTMFAGIKDLDGDGSANNKDLRLRLQATAWDLGAYGTDSQFGFGLIDATAAWWAPFEGDCDDDGDVDGVDMSIFAEQFSRGMNAISVESLARHFGVFGSPR
jgi:subtilisin